MDVKPDFKKVYETFYPKIFQYLSRIVGPDDAEDITQDVFIKVSRALPDFKGKSKLSTWLYRIATNAASDKFRSSDYKHSSDRTYIEDMAGAEDRDILTDQNSPPPEKSVIRKEMSVCVREFIDKLPPDYRMVIILSDLEGFSNLEISDILDISIENVKIRLHRARTKLRKELDTGCDFYHDPENVLSCDRKQVSIMPKIPGQDL